MKTFKTKAGTELPFLNLKGKDYIQVAHRIVWFREEHPEGQIKTEIVKLENDYCIFKATIYDANPSALATAHGREDAKHFPDFIEKSETKAIGRALALCGYGTQFAPELDEEDRLADAPTTRANFRANTDHVKAAINTFGPDTVVTSKVESNAPLIKDSEGIRPIQPAQVFRINQLITKTKANTAQLRDFMKTQWNSDEIPKLTETQAATLIEMLQKKAAQ